MIKEVGYYDLDLLFNNKSCEIKSYLDEQSPDINHGVMFGYACYETENDMPISIEISHKLL